VIFRHIALLLSVEYAVVLVIVNSFLFLVAISYVVRPLYFLDQLGVWDN